MLGNERERECVWLQKMGYFWVIATAVLPAAAVILAGSKKEREEFCEVTMKRDPNEIVLFIPLLFILQSLQ